ncbi:AMIN domain-containing protein [Leptolyngbyaceae cyanobacterium UHCC 1019]
MQNPKFEPKEQFLPAEDFSVDVPQLLRVGLVGMLTAGTLAIAAMRVQAAALTNWRYDPAARQLEVTVKEGVTPRYFLMAQPARIVLDLPDTEVGEVSVKETYSGAIRQVRVSQFQPGLTRIVMELSTDAVFAPGQVKLEKTNQSTWVLRPLIANASTAKTVAETVGMPPSQASSQAVAVSENANKPTPNPVSALPPPPSSELDLPASFPPVPPKSSATVVTVPPTAPSAQKDALQPASAQPAPPEGSDVSPMNNTLMEGDVSLPPVASRSVQSNTPRLTTAPPPQVIPVGMPVESFANVSRIAQVSPTEKTTPLPPSAAQSPSDLSVDVTNAVKLEVPPPVLLPAASVVMPTPAAPRSLAIPATITGLSIQTQPLAVPTIAPLTAPTAIEASKLGDAIEIPSTIRIASNRPAQVTVPAIAVSTPTQNPTPQAAVPSSITFAAPPATAMPPLDLPVLPAPVSPVVVQPPVPSVMQPTLPTMQPQLPTLQPAALPVLQPPISSVMQSAEPIQSPQIQSSQLQPTQLQPVRPIQPPISSVMQSGPPMMPLPSTVAQPPVSSVIQMPAMQSPMPSSGYNPPAIAATVFPSTMVQPTSLPQPTFLEGGSSQTAMVSVLPLQTPALTPQAPAVSVPPLQPMDLPTATVTPIQMSPTVPSGDAFPPPSTIEFGKSLPVGGANGLNTAPATLPNYSATTSATAIPMMPSVTSPLTRPMMYQSTVPGLILPAGAMLMLSYPGTVDLSLTAGMPRQEVLILQTEVRDSVGNIVFPRGSFVTGQFDTNREGSRFIAMAITQSDRAIPFAAESDAITGNREISGSSLALFSGAGALAGGLVSNFSGLGVLLGGAAGAATNLFTSPKPATIQPGQIIQVRMTREVR